MGKEKRKKLYFPRKLPSKFLPSSLFEFLSFVLLMIGLKRREKKTKQKGPDHATRGTQLYIFVKML